MSSTRFLPGFSHRLCGRQSGATTENVRRRAERLDGLSALLARFLPRELFAPGVGERERIYTPWITVVAFLSLVLTRRSACREALRRVQAWCVAARRSPPDESSSAYCRARARLPLQTKTVGGAPASHGLDRAPRDRNLALVRPRGEGAGRMRRVHARHGRHGTRYDYARGQKPGCGFPTGQMLELFCLATGPLVRFALGTWKAHEIPLARQLVGWIEPGEVVLADRGFFTERSGWMKELVAQ